MNETHNEFLKAIRLEEKYALPLGTLFFVISVAFFEDIVDYIFLALSFGFFAVYYLSKFRRSPIAFLVSSANSALLVAVLIYEITRGDSIFLNAFLLAILGYGSIGSIKRYAKFKDVQPGDVSEVEEEQKKPNKVVNIVKYVAFIILIGFGLIVYFGPQTGMLSQQQLTPEQISYFKEAGYLSEAGEHLVLVTFTGTTDYKESGIFLTNTKLALYSNYEDAASAIIVPLEEVRRVWTGEDAWNGQVFFVETKDGEEIQFRVSAAQADKEKFLQKLKHLVKKVRTEDTAR